MSVTVGKCLQAWANSLWQMKIKADIVFFGDSLTYYGDLSTEYHKIVCNLGLRGDDIQGMINRIEQVKLVQPSVMFLMIGTNDAASCSAEEFNKRYA